MVRDLEMTFVLCVKNAAYGASLEVRKIYRAVPDSNAARRSLVRVVDDSGEDYLYPAENFVPNRGSGRSRARIRHPSELSPKGLRKRVLSRGYEQL